MSAKPELIAVEPPTTELVVTPSKGGWGEFVDRWCPQYASHAKILNGSLILLIGSVFVSLANFGYNIGVARLLGPSDFSHAAAAVTILMLISAITLSFQLVCTKLVAKADTIEAKAAVFQHLMKRAWAIGFGLGAFMLFSSSVLTTYLRLSSPWIIILLTRWPDHLRSAGSEARRIARHLPLPRTRVEHGRRSHREVHRRDCTDRVRIRRAGSSRGDLSFGHSRFRLPDKARELRGPAVDRPSAPVGEARQAIVFFVGQVIISNIDILMVKHFFRPDHAGLYAAIALVGRLALFRRLVGGQRDVPGFSGRQDRAAFRLSAGDSTVARHRHVDCVSF